MLLLFRGNELVSTFEKPLSFTKKIELISEAEGLFFSSVLDCWLAGGNCDGHYFLTFSRPND